MPEIAQGAACGAQAMRGVDLRLQFVGRTSSEKHEYIFVFLQPGEAVCSCERSKRALTRIGSTETCIEREELRRFFGRSYKNLSGQSTISRHIGDGDARGDIAKVPECVTGKEMNSLWVGVQDYADIAPKWLDESVSFSWLRAFERANKRRMRIAYCREQNYTRDLVSPIRGVHYRFRKEQFPKWIDELIAASPDIILYNICEYNIGARAMASLAEALPGASHVIRLHHEVRYLIAHTGFRECVLASDKAIVPTPRQVADLQSIGFRGEISHIPFGIDRRPFENARVAWGRRDIDFVCANTNNPQKNMNFLGAVFGILRDMGYTAINLSDLNTEGLAYHLGRSKIFFQPSMTEASGSRVLLEGIAAGCFPVALAESRTTAEVALEHGGEVLESGTTYDFTTKTIVNADGSEEAIAQSLRRIIETLNAQSGHNGQLIDTYSDGQEIKSLLDALQLCPAKNWEGQPLARAARCLEKVIGLPSRLEEPEQLLAWGTRAAASPAHRPHAPACAAALAQEFALPECVHGLQEKLFREDFDFRANITWLHREALQLR